MFNYYGNKSVFFFTAPENLKTVRELCDVLWNQHQIATRIDTSYLATKSTESIKNFLNDFKAHPGKTKIFIVNNADYHHQGILQELTNLPIYSLTMGNSLAEIDAAEKEILSYFGISMPII